MTSFRCLLACLLLLVLPFQGLAAALPLAPCGAHPAAAAAMPSAPCHRAGIAMHTPQRASAAAPGHAPSHDHARCHTKCAACGACCGGVALALAPTLALPQPGAGPVRAAIPFRARHATSADPALPERPPRSSLV